MIIQGDCLEKMHEMADNSIDFILTDPPYGLYFMGKNWDGRVPSIEIWVEALRVCKPGSMLAAFGGSRTHHHLMLAIEEAGWEIRDVIMWLYGQGFPKSLDIGKAINKKINGDSINELAKTFQGYGTSLKPAYEPIILAMKPLDGTFEKNAKKWGVAGMNIEDSRIGNDEIKTQSKLKGQSFTSVGTSQGFNGCEESYHIGRWPANVILDEEAAQNLDEMSGVLKSGSLNSILSKSKNKIYGKRKVANPNAYNSSEGGASRFFYCAKASSKERGKDNIHPTVKPLSLMKYLLKLLAPPGDSIILDPFAGSGTTLLAAKELGIRAIGIEKESEYCEIAKKRIDTSQTSKSDVSPDIKIPLP
jgi:DNA modification methylase